MPKILSIDIGVKNLALCQLDIMPQSGLAIIEVADNAAQLRYPNITFKLHDISTAKNALNRCKAVQELLRNVKEDVTAVVIEKQVPQNTVAMELMYSIISFALSFTENIYLFPPKEKFDFLNIEYNTKNKAHKKLSVDIAKKFLMNNYPALYQQFCHYDKQDDIADALNQALVFGVKNKYLPENILKK